MGDNFLEKGWDKAKETAKKLPGAGEIEENIRKVTGLLGATGHPEEQRQELVYASPEEEEQRKKLLAGMMQILFGPAAPTLQINPQMMGLSALQRGPSTLPPNFQPYQIAPLPPAGVNLTPLMNQQAPIMAAPPGVRQMLNPPVMPQGMAQLQGLAPQNMQQMAPTGMDPNLRGLSVGTEQPIPGGIRTR